MGRVINQAANYAGEFGAAFRSSAIFFKPKDIKTTISLSNYWDFKNGLTVGIVISVRCLKGNLVSREEVSFGDSNVINFEVSSVDEGSVEIEAFSSENLRIPYAAIMVVYESKNGVSMVHSYGRNHSLIELEEDNAILQARESCWTLRMSENTSNKAIFHNGHVELDSQEAIFKVTRTDGAEEQVSFTLPLIQKYETVIFDAEDIFPNLRGFLGTEDGWGTLHFESQSSFTRLLILWENSDSGEVQVTHSNFDYSAHQTNMIESSKPAYMVLPLVNGSLPDVIVYPKFSRGNYIVNNGCSFSNGVVIDSNEQILAFRRSDGDLPARIVTAASAKLNQNTIIPFECSLGVVHEKRPPKRFHWFLISKKHPSTIHLTAYEDIYPVNESIELIFRLYSDTTKNAQEKIITFSSIKELTKEVAVEDVFDLSNIESFGYVSIFSHYGGLFVYSSLQKGNSITLEHSF
ncbi:MAG: hypothetical protein O3C07_03260 [Bacteroidetes bacterium]|nr:hypothetical protein [Bacteroidota bacterium]